MAIETVGAPELYHQPFLAPDLRRVSGFAEGLAVATFQLNHAFRCRICKSANQDKIFLFEAIGRSRLERTVREIHLGCKVCVSATSVNKRVKISLKEATPVVKAPWYGISQVVDATDEVTAQSADLLEAIYYLEHLIINTEDAVENAEYVKQLNELKSKLIALGPAAVPLAG